MTNYTKCLSIKKKNNISINFSTSFSYSAVNLSEIVKQSIALGVYLTEKHHCSCIASFSSYKIHAQLILPISTISISILLLNIPRSRRLFFVGNYLKANLIFQGHCRASSLFRCTLSLNYILECIERSNAA